MPQKREVTPKLEMGKGKLDAEPCAIEPGILDSPSTSWIKNVTIETNTKRKFRILRHFKSAGEINGIGIYQERFSQLSSFSETLMTGTSLFVRLTKP